MVQSILSFEESNNDAAGGGYVDGSADNIRYNGSFLVQRSVNMSKPIVSIHLHQVRLTFMHLHIIDIRFTQLPSHCLRFSCR